MNTKLMARLGLLLITASTGLLVGAPTASADRTVTVNSGAGNINVQSGPSTGSQLLRTTPNRTRWPSPATRAARCTTAVFTDAPPTSGIGSLVVAT
jgi:hypothetical protein